MSPEKFVVFRMSDFINFEAMEVNYKTSTKVSCSILVKNSVALNIAGRKKSYPHAWPNMRVTDKLCCHDLALLVLTCVLNKSLICLFLNWQVYKYHVIPFTSLAHFFLVDV